MVCLCAVGGYKWSRYVHGASREMNEPTMGGKILAQNQLLREKKNT